LIHIIDVRETIRGLLRARKYLQKVASTGGLVLFVGTKRQASDTIDQQATRCGMPFVSDRWLGGTLTTSAPFAAGSLAWRAGSPAIQRRVGDVFQKNAVFDEPRISEDDRNLNGMRMMNRLPECLVVIDPRKEKNAIGEAKSWASPLWALIDTDCDPDEVDLPIPGNDDSIRSIELIVQLLADAWRRAAMPPARRSRSRPKAPWSPAASTAQRN